MSKQVGKCSVFTKDNLPKIQDKMKDKCIESFNKEYGLNAVLKDKQKVRNIDYRVSQMADNLFINGIMDEKEYTSVINKKEKNYDNYER